MSESSSPDSYREVEHNKMLTTSHQARVAQLVEHNLAKVGVAGSNPVSRSKGRTSCGFFISRPVCRQAGSVVEPHASVVELVDTQDLKSCGHCVRTGSSPVRGTHKPDSRLIVRLFLFGFKEDSVLRLLHLSSGFTRNNLFYF